MDQAKIGKFIAMCRKQQKLTQLQLAEKLSVTDRAVSKWETGKAMPDTAIMLDLCAVLNITVNNLLCGEVISMENYNKELEKNLLDAIKQKEQADKRLLTLEIFIGALCCAVLLGMDIIAALLPIAEWLRVVLIFVGLIPLLVALPFMLRIEQLAGYYECAKCGHRYIPTFKSVFMAPHMGRTRHMRCPKCNKKSWQKKVLTKEE